MTIVKHEPGFPAIFISGEVAGEDPALNDLNTDLLAFYLGREGLTFDRVLGSYGGVAEHSFRVCLPVSNVDEALRQLDVVRKLARGFLQESWLVVRADGLCTLMYSDHRPSERIGYWHRVDVADLNAACDYSRIGDEFYQVLS